MERLPIFKGHTVDLGIEKVTLPNGHSLELEVVRHPGATAIVPLHEDGTITLIHQFRHAGGGMMVEVVAGKLDNGEVPDLCARRELKEEVGLECERLTRLGMIHTTPGFSDELIFLFVAEGLTETGATPEPEEYIRPWRMTIDEAKKMVMDGDITDAKTICALTLLDNYLAKSAGG